MDESASALLATVARHGAVAEEVVAAHHAPTGPAVVGERLRWLAERGLLAQARSLPVQSWCCWLTERGAKAIGHPLAPPVITASSLRSDLAASWAWRFAADGRLPDAEVLTRRDAIVRDGPLLESGPGRGGPCGLRVGGLVEQDSTGLHHPDVALLWPQGWAAAEVQIGWPDPRRLSALLAAYGADARYGHVLFLVEDARVARVVDAAISVAGLSESARAWRLPFEARFR